MTTAPPPVVLIATLLLLIFSDGISVVVVVNSAYNTNRIAGDCDGLLNYLSNNEVVRNLALKSMDAAIDFAASKRPNTCAHAENRGIWITAAANCSHRITNDDDCKLCLYNAQYRVVDQCPYMKGGWLELADCCVSYSTNPSFCWLG
ncbi:unnamed protein product [Linum trigynum]